LYISGTVYFDAQFPESVILDAVIAAVLAYCQNLNVNNSLTGEIENNDIIAAIRAVAGVKDFSPVNIWARIDAGAFPATSVTKLIDTSTIVYNNYQTYAGYIIPTTDAGYTLTDGLTFTAA
jgi:hypothetical protein